jgi:ABC-type transporter Mla MlaB component
MDGMQGPGSGMPRLPRNLALTPDVSKPTGTDPTDSYHAGEVVVQLREPDPMHALDDVQWRFNSLLEQGARTLVVDLSQVGQLSSTTIAALLWVMRRCSARGVKVVLREPSRRSVTTLARIGLGTLGHPAGEIPTVRRA